MSQGARDADRVTRGTLDGFDLYARADDAECRRIVHRYLAAAIRQEDLAPNWPTPVKLALDDPGGTLRLTALSYTNPNRLVFRVETRGRRYLLKWMRRGSIGLKRLFPGSVGLTMYTRLFRKVRRAVMGGCVSTQDYHLVAEKWAGALRMEVIALLEYIDGETLGLKDDIAAHRDELERAAADVLAHGLTLDDMSPHNFIVTDAGIRVIDLSCRPPTRLNAVKMAMKMNARYGLNLPIRGIVNNALRAALALRYRVRAWLGKTEQA